MAFGAKKIFPIDQRPGTAVGVAIPFNAPGTFFSTYITKDAIRNNLINFFLTNKTERYLNNDFGGNLRAYIFEQISYNTINSLQNNIQSLVTEYFPDVIINNLNIVEDPDNNALIIQLYYSIKNTGITDQAQITFA